MIPIAGTEDVPIRVGTYDSSLGVAWQDVVLREVSFRGNYHGPEHIPTIVLETEQEELEAQAEKLVFGLLMDSAHEIYDKVTEILEGFVSRNPLDYDDTPDRICEVW